MRFLYSYLTHTGSVSQVFWLGQYWPQLSSQLLEMEGRKAGSKSSSKKEGFQLTGQHNGTEGFQLTGNGLTVPLKMPRSTQSSPLSGKARDFSLWNCAQSTQYCHPLLSPHCPCVRLLCAEVWKWGRLVHGEHFHSQRNHKCEFETPWSRFSLFLPNPLLLLPSCYKHYLKYM